jgi:glutathione S-transferase
MDTPSLAPGVSLAVGGAVGGVCKYLVQTGLTGARASVAAMVIAAFFLLVYAFSAHDFTREMAWPYLVVWVETLTAAAAAFHGLSEAQKKIAKDIEDDGR